MNKLCHLTSAHSCTDIRVFLKQCTSLAAHGCPMALIVADSKYDEVKIDVRLLDADASKGRLHRMCYAPARLSAEALTLDADVYHLHPPDLITIGLKLKKLAEQFFFGTHEDLPQQFRSNPNLSASTRLILSLSFVLQKGWDYCRFDAMLNVLPRKIVLWPYARRDPYREFLADRQQSGGGLASLLQEQCGSSK